MAPWQTSCALAALCALFVRGVHGDSSPVHRLRDARDLRESPYQLDGRTTYCWDVRAAASDSNVTDDMVARRGVGADCPLVIEVQLSQASYQVNQSVSISWTVTPSARDDSANAMFKLADVRFLVDKSTLRQATIIHSNAHVCLDAATCGPFARSDAAYPPTTNQIGNITTEGARFSSDEIAFRKAGTFVVLAHIIVPGRTAATRYDLATFKAVEIRDASSQDFTSTSGSRRAIEVSSTQIIILVSVGVLVLVLAAIAAYLSLRKRQRPCRKTRQNSDPLSTKQSNFSFVVQDEQQLHDARSSDWADVYAVDDTLPPSILVDDVTTIAILRASRASTPAQSPPPCERTVADFRHDVARWDVSSSASPITPSSSAILFAALQDDPDRVASTPASDCFVPLESFMAPPPRRKCMTIASSHRPPKSKHKPKVTTTAAGGPSSPPDDSEDEQEVEI
ncbi:hypothetical protein PINS_up009100 [Pythium insidiosum]|nr:hypothetical protein PINS_up009100 [Pythium insidiosum]